MTLLVLMGISFTASATNFITDVMLLGYNNGTPPSSDNVMRQSAGGTTP